jgi:hypothetical protein
MWMQYLGWSHRIVRKQMKGQSKNMKDYKKKVEAAKVSN